MMKAVKLPNFANPETTLTARKRKRVVPVIIVSFLTMIFFISSIFLYRNVFIVRTISCSFADQPCPEVAIVELERLKTQSIWNSFSETQNKFKTALRQASHISFSRKLPSTLIVTMTPSDILGVLNADISSGYAIVNKNGHVTEIVVERPTGLTVMRMKQVVKVGDEIESEMKSVLEEFSGHGQSIPLVEVFYKDKDEIELRLQNGKTAIVRSFDLATQLNTLQLLLNEATMIEKVSVIDVRFSHPVLR